MALEGPPGQIHPVYDVTGAIIGRQAYQYVTIQGVGRCMILVTTYEPNPSDPMNIKVHVSTLERPGGGYESIDFDDGRFQQLQESLRRAFNEQRSLSPQMAMEIAGNAGIPMDSRLLANGGRGR